MDGHVPLNPLFVLEVTTSCEAYLNELENRLLECAGVVSIEVNEKIKEVRVRGNVKPLELISKLGEKAELAYYNKDPARIGDFESEINGKEKEKYSGRKKEKEEVKEDHYKPYVYKEHDPVFFPSSMSGEEFFDYFGGVRSENHKRNRKRYDVPTVDPYAHFPDHFHSKHYNPGYNSGVPMRSSVLPPYFY